MKEKEDQIADLKRMMDNFSQENGDIIERVGFVDNLIGQGKVVQNETGQYQMSENNNW